MRPFSAEKMLSNNRGTPNKLKTASSETKSQGSTKKEDGRIQTPGKTTQSDKQSPTDRSRNSNSNRQ